MAEPWNVLPVAIWMLLTKSVGFTRWLKDLRFNKSRESKDTDLRTEEEKETEDVDSDRLLRKAPVESTWPKRFFSGWAFGRLRASSHTVPSHVLLGFLRGRSSWRQALGCLLGLLWSVLHWVPEQPLGCLSCEPGDRHGTEEFKGLNKGGVWLQWRFFFSCGGLTKGLSFFLFRCVWQQIKSWNSLFGVRLAEHIQYVSDAVGEGWKMKRGRQPVRLMVWLHKVFYKPLCSTYTAKMVLKNARLAHNLLNRFSEGDDA